MAATADVDAVLQDLWRDWADPPEVRSFQQSGRGLVSPRKMAVGAEVFRDTPLVAIQNLFSQRLTPCCLGCMAPVGSFRQLLQRILRNASQTLESDFPSVNDELLSQPTKRIAWPCPTPGCKMLFCSEACRERELQRGAHRLLCVELVDLLRLRKWAQFKALARQHHENLLLAAMAFAWAICQVKYHQVPLCRALAELLACQSERWDSLVTRQHEKRRRVLQESYALLQEVLDCNGFSEEVYARVLGEFDLVNVSIEFDHPFQASLDELQSLRLAMHDSGLMRRLVEVANCRHEADSVQEDELEQELPTIFGIGLARRVALMNHSCRPNCEIDYDGNATAVVKAIRPIHAGEACATLHQSGEPCAG